MANVFLDLPLPVDNGPGASVDTSGMGSPKTLTVIGTFEGCTITIEASVDGGTVFAAVALFQPGGAEVQVVEFAADHMRCNVSGRKSTIPFAADIDVGSPQGVCQFSAITLPAGNGAGPALNISTFDSLLTVIAGGTFDGCVIFVQISEDNVEWAQLTSFAAQGGILSEVATANFIRAFVSGRKSTIPFSGSLALGAVTPGGASGGVDILNQGIALAGNPHPTLNFVGAGVTATDAGAGVATITIPGGVPVVAQAVDYFDDFLSDRLSFFAATGGGVNTPGGDMGNNHPGTYTQSVTAAAVDGAQIACAQANATVGSVYFGGGIATWEAEHQIPVLSGGAQRIDLRVGMHDGVGVAEPQNGCYLEYSLALDGSQNYFLCAALGGARTKVDTGIAAVAGNVRKAILTVNAAGTLLSATIDGVASALTVAANIPVAAANAVFPANLQLVKALGATILSVRHDYYKFDQSFTVAR